MAAAAHAESVPLSAAEINNRLEVSTQLLQEQETKADYWEYGWGTFDAGTMLYSIAEATNDSNDHKARNTDIVNASESLIGLADLIFRPLPALGASSVCPAYMATQEEATECLAAKERLLESSAERARDPYTLLPHLGNMGINLLAGLIVNRIGGPGRALSTAIPGEIIGELQLWNTPRQPIADYNQYRIQFSPLLMETGHAQSPAAGVAFSLRF